MKKKHASLHRFLWIVIFFLAAASLALIFHALMRQKHHVQQVLYSHGQARAAMAAAATRKIIEASGKRLELLAKFPLFSQIEKKPALLPIIKDLHQYWIEVADAYLFSIGNAYGRMLVFQQAIEYWSELPQALQRRVKYEAARLFSGAENDEDSYDNEKDDSYGLPPAPLDFSKEKSNHFYRHTMVARNLVLTLQIKINEFFDFLAEIALKLDQFARLGHSSLANQLKVEKFLSIAVNDRDCFAGLKVFNRFGRSMTDFSATGINREINDYLIGNKFAAGVNFWLGPAFFSRENRLPFLQIAVPLKDGARNVCGGIRAAANLASIEEVLKSNSTESDGELLLLNHDFTTLVSSSPDRALNQISFISNLAAQPWHEKDSQPSWHFLHQQSNSDIFLVPLTSFQERMIPPWKIALIQKRPGHSFFSADSLEIALIVLAVMAFLVLFYSALQITKMNEQEML